MLAGDKKASKPKEKKAGNQDGYKSSKKD